MKAPDKIYLGIDDTESGYVYNLSLDNNGHPEYIRKDAMLDWIKAQLAENEEWREVNPDDRFFGGKEVAYDYVIEMINKL